MKYTVYADGLCEPNPGPASWAFVVFDPDGNEVASDSGFMKDATNNIAEYRAVIEALVHVHEMDDHEVLILTDSQLVVKQLKGEWQVKSEKLQSWFDNTNDLIQSNVKIEWVKGVDNKADELTRLAYEKETGLYPMPRTHKGQWKAKLVRRETPSRETGNIVDYDKIAF